MRHGRVGHALEQVHAVDDRGQELVRARRPVRLRRLPPPDRQEQAIDLLPHLGADLFADLPRVLARGADAGGDRLAVRQVDVRAIECEVQVDVDEPRDVLRTLEIPARPEQAVGDPRQHAHGARSARAGGGSG